MNNSRIIKFCTVSIAAVGIVLNPVIANGNTYASNNSETQKTNNSGVLQVVNDEQAVFKLDNNGVALLINKDTGKSEKLPSEGKDKNGKQVTYLYTEDNHHLILNAMSKEAASTRGTGECITGVAGEGVFGAGSVEAAGAGVGGVGGSLKGASDHCFN